MESKKKAGAPPQGPPACVSDTSRWEALLSGGGGNTLGYRGLAGGSPPPAASSKPSVYDRDDASRPSGSRKRMKKKGKQGSGAGHVSAVSASNNQAAPGGRRTDGGITGAAGQQQPHSSGALSNGHAIDPPTGKRKKDNRRGKKRPRPEDDQANGVLAAAPNFFPPNFFPAKKHAGALGAQSPLTLPQSNRRQNTDAGDMGSKKGQQRGTNALANGPSKATGVVSSNGSLAANRRSPSKHHRRNAGKPVSDATAMAAHAASKRPRPNSLNLAFQAQKAANADVDKKGGNKARGKAGGGWGKGKTEQAVTAAEQSRYVGLDCEMVGVGPGARRSALARCCLVDWDGRVIYDKHVVPNERVTDFRTFVSGVKAKHLRGGLDIRQCQKEVAAMLEGKVLVGHALHHDLKVEMNPTFKARGEVGYALGTTGGIRKCPIAQK